MPQNALPEVSVSPAVLAQPVDSVVSPSATPVDVYAAAAPPTAAAPPLPDLPPPPPPVLTRNSLRAWAQQTGLTPEEKADRRRAEKTILKQCRFSLGWWTTSQPLKASKRQLCIENFSHITTLPAGLHARRIMVLRNLAALERLPDGIEIDFSLYLFNLPKVTDLPLYFLQWPPRRIQARMPAEGYCIAIENTGISQQTIEAFERLIPVFENEGENEEENEELIWLMHDFQPPANWIIRDRNQALQLANAMLAGQHTLPLISKMSPAHVQEISARADLVRAKSWQKLERATFAIDPEESCLFTGRLCHELQQPVVLPRKNNDEPMVVAEFTELARWYVAYGTHPSLNNGQLLDFSEVLAIAVVQ